MRPGFVVVSGVGPEDPLEVSSLSHQHPVEALRAHGAYLPLGERVGAWRPERGSDHLDAFGPEHLVERTRVIRVAVVNECPHAVETTVDG